MHYPSSALGALRTYLHADHQGSIIALSNKDGTGIQKLTYDSFGIPKTSNANRFGYTGQIWFKELGLFYYKARMYDPILGRFLQTDPIFYADNMNMYAYVGNDPVNKIDPTGMATSLVVNTFKIGRAGYKHRSLSGAVRGVGREIAYDWNQLGSGSTATAGQQLGSAADLIFGTAFNESAETPNSPEINPSEVAGQTPEKIDEIAKAKGLIPQGPNPQAGQGSYTDPVTGKQRILVHPDADCGAHCHVNDPEGNRLDEAGNKVPPESPEAHLPLRR